MTSFTRHGRVLRNLDLEFCTERAKIKYTNMATNRSLRAVREQIVFAYAENIIDADEFLLLYDAN